MLSPSVLSMCILTAYALFATTAAINTATTAALHVLADGVLEMSAAPTLK